MSSMYGSTGRASGRNSPTGRGNMAPEGYNVGQIQNYSPEQMDLFKSMFSNVGPDSYLGKLAGGDEETFSQIEQPALRQFSGLQGNIASRFSGMGSMGGRRSSGFQNTMTQAGSDFAGQLQSRRMDLQRQAIKDLMGLSGDLLDKKPYENYLMEQQQPFWQKIAGGALPIAGAGVGAFFGGAPGAKIGGKVGAAAGQAFF